MDGQHSQNDLYLKPSVKLELLASRWYAWAHLIAPVQHAMNIAFRHLPMMQSFVNNPQIHIAATKDPALIGGPFLNLPVTAVPAVKTLIQETTAQCAQLLAFARDFKKFDQSLQEGANGFCLSDFYERVPASLAGSIEISYDLNNHPLLRVIEEIIYKYHLDNRHTQELHICHTRDSERNFFMSTPRLASGGAYTTKLPFNSPKLDWISSMRTKARPFDEICSAFGVNDDNRGTFASFFTQEAPITKTPHYTGDGVRIRYFGHACVLIQTSRSAILIDPLVTFDPDEGDGHFSFADLPDVIDAVVISHCHQDHFVPEMLVQLRHRVRKVIIPRNRSGNIADPSMSLILKRLGYSNIEVLDAFGTISLDEGEITSLPFSGEHADLDIHSKQTILANIKGHRFFFLVDSDAIDPALYKLVTEIVGKPDALFVGMECFGAPLSWLYGPLLTKPMSRRDDESRRLSASNCERAWRLVTDLKCSHMYIYAMGQEPWLRYLMGMQYTADSIQLKQAQSFVTRCTEAGLNVEHLNGSRELFF
jgi:L-ascorbate metabolism protein UlaG (beta-lactamase superfamily)